ncbi:MAG: transglutaminase-like domain-containing protein [Oscillospiraceae bacterium]|nr:transglutaminase-like domain-containing protein [Oscillospiraceae bacterium]
MMISKKLTAAALSLLLLFSASYGFLSCTVNAENAVSSAVPDKYEKLKSIIRDGFRKKQSRIDISSCGFSLSALRRDSYCFIYDVLFEKEFYYVSPTGKFEISEDGTATAFNAKYYSEDKTVNSEDNTRRYDELISSFTKDMDSGWSDLRKAAFLYDKLRSSAIYISGLYWSREEYYNYKEENYFTVTSPLYVLSQGRGNCVGFARLYSVLLKEAGIQSMPVMNDTHIWDLVLIDGQWYHADCSGGTVSEERASQGKISHDMFLKSDKYTANRLRSFYPSGLSVSEKYDSAGWNTSERPLAFSGDRIVFLRSKLSGGSGKLYIVSCDKDGKERRETEIRDKWSTSYTWHKKFSTLVQYKDKIYYNTARAVMMYDPETDKSEQIYRYEKKDRCLTGIVIEDGYICGYFSKSPSGTSVKEKLVSLDDGN